MPIVDIDERAVFERVDGDNVRVGIHVNDANVSFLIIMRKVGPGTVRIGFKAEELDKLGDTIKRCRELLLGVRDDETHAKAALLAAAGMKPKRRKK